MTTINEHNQPTPTASSWTAQINQEFQANLRVLTTSSEGNIKQGNIKQVSSLLQELVEKLRVIKEYDRYDPRNLPSIVAKENYAQVELLEGHRGYVRCLQALPDGRIVSGGYVNTLRIWTRGANGSWTSEELEGHRGYVCCLQALPDGRIVSGGYYKTGEKGDLRIWTRGANGSWTREKLEGHTGWVSCLQALPDGRIVSAGQDTTIRIWDGEVISDVLKGSITEQKRFNNPLARIKATWSRRVRGLDR